MINLTATNSKAPQTIAEWNHTSGTYWCKLKTVAWISQDKTNLKTTIYLKWQTESNNYWPYWNDAHTYTISFGGQSTSWSFALPQNRTNGAVDRSTTNSITVSHNSSTGACSGTFRFQGAKFWETFDYSEAGAVPTITVTPPSPEPTPTPDPGIVDRDGAPIVNDGDSNYYILCDGEVLYAQNDEERVVVNPKLTLEVNQTDSLDFLLPPTNIMYDRVAKLESTIEVLQGTETLFRGRVLSDDRDFYNRKDVHCEGALSFLGDTIMDPYAEGAYSTAKELFYDAINSHVQKVPSSSPKRKITYTRCNITSATSLTNDEYSYTLDVIRSLLDEQGGYLKLEYYSDGTTGLSYLTAYDHSSSQIIDFGENLLDLKVSIDSSNIYTSVVALGKKDDDTGIRLTTGSGSAMYVEDADAISKYGRIIRLFTYDDITSQAELIKMANFLLAVGVNPDTSIEANAVDLHLVYPNTEKLRIGDDVYIRSGPHSIDGYFKCSKIDLDLQNPDSTSYTFGATAKALTDATSKK